MFNWYFLLYRRHIISASYMDIFFGVENTHTYPRNIPNVEMFEMNVRGSAVNNRDHVVIYENTGRYGFFLGARTWWMFKVIIRRYNCHCHHHHHHKAFILITVIQSLFSSSSFIFYRHEAKARADNLIFHTNHYILSTRASSWCLCLQECGKGLILISFIINLLLQKENCFLW